MISIHIGFPKAGSTTIQTYLDVNQAALRELSVDFPSPGRAGRAHHKIAHELAGQMDKVNRDVGGVSDLVAHVSGAMFDTTIISSECFTPFTVPMVSKLSQSFSGAGQPFRIVQVIRPLVELAASSYAQRTRHGGLTYDFDQFFEILLTRDKFNAIEVASRWAEVFGWEAMRIIVLDPIQLQNRDLVADFLAAIDLDPEAPALRALPRPPRANESTGWRALEAVRALFRGQSGLDDDHPLVKRVAEAGHRRTRKRRIGAAAEEVAAEQGWSQDRGRYLTREQAERLNHDYIVAVMGLNERLDAKLPEPLDLDARGFVARDFLPSLDHIPPAELKAFYDTMAERLVLHDNARLMTKKGLSAPA